MPPHTDMMELPLPHCMYQKAWLRSWKAEVTGRRSNLQSNCDTRLVPIYHCWVLRKMAPSLDKWELFSGINTTSLTLTGTSRHLIPETLLFAIYIAFIPSGIPIYMTLLTATYCIYYHWNTTFIAPLLTSPSEFIWQVPHRCHPSQSLGNTCCLDIPFPKDIKGITILSKRFLGFSSSPKRVTHPLVLERNLTPTYLYIYINCLINSAVHYMIKFEWY